MKNYKELNGYHFNVAAPDAVCEALSGIDRDTRIRVWYGDPVTGKSFDEIYDITGYVSRSGGMIKVPLLINNTRSMGGGAILCSCVVKVVETRSKKVLYQHPTFSQSVFTTRDRFVHKDGLNTFAELRTPEQAKRFADFMNGKRMNP